MALDAAARRVANLSDQLAAQDCDGAVPLARRPAAATDGATELAVALPEKLSDGDQWRVYRNAQFPRALRAHYEPPGDHIGTLYDNLEFSVSRYPNEPFLGTRRRGQKGKLGGYSWLTYSQASERRTAIGSGLLSLGVPSGACVGLYGINSADWMVVDFALHAYSMISVPLYDTLGPDAVQYIVGHAEVVAVACAPPQAATLVKCLHECPSVRLVVRIAGEVVWGLEGLPLPALPPGSSCRIVRLEELERIGQTQPHAHLPPRPRDVATISYTSGTTGQPKGAVLSHANLIANSAGTAHILQFQPGDTHISYLPLAHIYERVNTINCTHHGAAIGFYSGDVTQLLDDIAELKPTVFTSVPRLWNRIYDKVMAGVNESNPIARSLFRTAFASKRAALEQGDLSGGRLAWLWDSLVFSKVKARLGGRVRIMTTGASPISEEVMIFLKICFPHTHMLEGYGMTETSCIISLMSTTDSTLGHVGSPIPCCEVKLVDIPEMNYLHTDRPNPRGEICVRGPIIFQGYYKNEEQTREVLDSEGWFHTGDVGTWLPGGRLKIIDRKKNIFKLAQGMVHMQGEYLAPEKIENVYVRSPLVLQSFVYGDSLKSQLVAVVVPDPDTLLPWAAERGLPQDMRHLCGEAAVAAAVLRSMQQEGQAAQLKGFEQVQAVHLTPEPFSVENGLLTPTFKLKRPQAKAAFQAAITAMYSKLEATH